MNQPRKLECITRQASRLKLDVLGLSEVRWKNSGKCTTDEHVMIYSGPKTEHKHGVGVLLSKQVAKSMMGKSPGDGVRNQIDYITANKRFRNSILQVKGYPGADGGSDHVPIVATLRM